MYVLPSAARRNAPIRRVRGMGCGCKAGLGSIPTLTASPFRRTITPSPVVARPVTSLPARWTTTSTTVRTRGAASGWPNRRRSSTTTKINTTGAPSTITNYDAYGNPVYSVPPPGARVTGYDGAGNPIYGGASSGSQPAGVQTSAIVGYDSYGNPIYAGSAAASSLLTSSAADTGAAAAPVTAAPATESDYQTVLDWLSEETLISGVPNWGVAAGGVAAFLLLQSKLSGRR
jgi:hypothetical protein